MTRSRKWQIASSRLKNLPCSGKMAGFKAGDFLLAFPSLTSIHNVGELPMEQSKGPSIAWFRSEGANQRTKKESLRLERRGRVESHQHRLIEYQSHCPYWLPFPLLAFLGRLHWSNEDKDERGRRRGSRAWGTRRKKVTERRCSQWLKTLLVFTKNH